MQLAFPELKIRYLSKTLFLHIRNVLQELFITNSEMKFRWFKKQCPRLQYWLFESNIEGLSKFPIKKKIKSIIEKHQVSYNIAIIAKFST